MIFQFAKQAISAVLGTTFIRQPIILQRTSSSHSTFQSSQKAAFSLQKSVKLCEKTIVRDCCVDNNCQGLVPKKISSEFSYYLFTCIDMTWFDNAGTIPCINNQKLYDCRFPFPSHDEQLLIANALNLQCTKINEILSHIRSSIEEYKKLKQAVITQAVTKGVRGERR